MFGNNRTIRSAWTWVSLLVGLSVALTGAVTVAEGFRIGESSAVAAGLVMVVPGGWVALRAPFMRVNQSGDSVIYHSLFGRKRILLREIVAVQIGELDSVVASAFTPVVVLAGGEEVMFVHLAHYSKPRSVRDALRISQWVGVAPTVE